MLKFSVARLTGSAERVAILTPLEDSSLYFSARRPISVVQTGCAATSQA